MVMFDVLQHTLSTVLHQDKNHLHSRLPPPLAVASYTHCLDTVCTDAIDICSWTTQVRREAVQSTSLRMTLRTMHTTTAVSFRPPHQSQSLHTATALAINRTASYTHLNTTSSHWLMHTATSTIHAAALFSHRHPVTPNPFLHPQHLNTYILPPPLQYPTGCQDIRASIEVQDGPHQAA